MMKIEHVLKLVNERNRLLARINHLTGERPTEDSDPIPPKVMLAAEGDSGCADLMLDHSINASHSICGYNEPERTRFSFYELSPELVAQATKLLIDKWVANLDRIDVELAKVEGIKE